jgi:FtsP/CotA-like multicopper oxidase with cupredoxin domain
MTMTPLGRSEHHMHVLATDATLAYDRAFDDAQPLEGRQVVRVNLVARETMWTFVPDKTTLAWGYNGQIPGPTIDAQVGDVLEVHLLNRLPEPTTIHWHGLRIPSAMDGTENVQRRVAPGDAFTYRYLLRDAGTFWYHPHTDETVQLERGLSGALIVRGPDEPLFDAERVLVLDDVGLDERGQIKAIGGFIENHDGRQGNTPLVNGRHNPEWTMFAGQIERWRVVNSASSRYVRLSIGRPFMLIGTDGGLLTSPVTMNEILLTPGDRADIAVGPFATGETIEIESLPYDRRTIKRLKRTLLATVHVGISAPSQASIPATLRNIEPLVNGKAEATREIHLGVRPALKTGVKFVVNKEAHHRDRPVPLGALQIWDIVNDTLMDHPFHLHGFFFQVVSVNGKAPAFLSWEDTVNVPPRSRVRIAWLPDDRPGEWMYHCHILEHHASGMMGHFEVRP